MLSSLTTWEQTELKIDGYIEYLREVWEDDKEITNPQKLLIQQQLKAVRNTILEYIEIADLRDEIKMANELCEDMGHVDNGNETICGCCHGRLIPLSTEDSWGTICEVANRLGMTIIGGDKELVVSYINKNGLA